MCASHLEHQHVVQTGFQVPETEVNQLRPTVPERIDWQYGSLKGYASQTVLPRHRARQRYGVECKGLLRVACSVVDGAYKKPNLPAPVLDLRSGRTDDTRMTIGPRCMAILDFLKPDLS